MRVSPLLRMTNKVMGEDCSLEDSGVCEFESRYFDAMAAEWRNRLPVILGYW